MVPVADSIRLLEGEGGDAGGLGRGWRGLEQDVGGGGVVDEEEAALLHLAAVGLDVEPAEGTGVFPEEAGHVGEGEEFLPLGVLVVDDDGQGNKFAKAALQNAHFFLFLISWQYASSSLPSSSLGAAS